MVALASLPVNVTIANLLNEPLVLAGGYVRLGALEAGKVVTIAGHSGGTKSQLWNALYAAEQAGHIGAGGLTVLTDPVPCHHQFVGGQDALGAVVPE